MIPTLDFETRSDAGFRWVGELRKWKSLPGVAETNRGLSVVGVKNYVAHESFGVLSLTYNLGSGGRLWTPQHDQMPWDLLKYARAGGVLKAWKVDFEETVWNDYCVDRWGWPELVPGQLRCAMAEARAHALPGALKNAADVLQLKHRKDKDGERLLHKFSMPRNPTKGDPRLHLYPHEDPEDGPKLYEYNAQDVRAEIEASERIPDLSSMELEIWQADQAVNRRGMGIDDAAVEDCIVIIEQADIKYNAELQAIAGCSASEVTQLLKWLHAQGVHLDNLREESVEGALKNMELPPAARRALRIRQMLGSASIKKLYALRHQSHKGRLYGLYSYFAARTGRWTANGPQPQNFPKGFFKSIGEAEGALACIAHHTLELVEYEYPEHDALDVVASCLRGLLVAGPGCELICSDFSAIEGVVTAALAGEEWQLEVFRTHGMIYEMTASQITGVPFEEFVRHKKETGQHHPQRQTVGKVATLASGFGGWIGAWKRFGADEFMTDEEIKQAILRWRERSPNIVELWGGQSRGRFNNRYPELYGLEGAAISALLNPGDAFAYRDTAYQAQAGVLYCRVRSGGLITYHEARLEQSTRDYAAPWELQISYSGWNSNQLMGPVGWIRMFLYGGKMTENVVQRVARDIQAHALVNLERAGYRPVIHTHDEVAGEVLAGTGSIEEFERIMSTLPAWCAGWPVKAKGGWRGRRYRKE